MNRLPNRIHIDRIVLDGFDLTPDQAERVRQMAVHELQRLMARGAVPEPRDGSESESPDHGFSNRSFAWEPGQGEQALAVQIAGQVAHAVRNQVKST